jgi:hypothetical protein
MSRTPHLVHATFSPESALDLPARTVSSVWQELFEKRLSAMRGVGKLTLVWSRSQALGSMGIEVKPANAPLRRRLEKAFYETWREATGQVRRGQHSRTVGVSCKLAGRTQRKAGRPRVLSYGGGIDSWAMLLEAIRRDDKPDVVCFMDVADGCRARNGKDPGEWLSTYRHVRQYVIPLCKKHGMDFVWLDSSQYPVRRGGVDEARSLFAWLQRKSKIPVSGPKRDCTIVVKVERFEDWMFDNWGSREVEVWIGFDAAEQERVERDCTIGKSTKVTRVNRFPLVEWGMCRCLCEWVAQQHPQPVPRKSACCYCPYGKRPDWEAFRAEMPRQFAKVCELERKKMRKRTAKGYQLSIKGYRNKHRDPRDRLRAERKRGGPVRGVDYEAPTIQEWLAKGGRGVKVEQCSVCGAYPKATKATGNTYLHPSEFVVVPPRSVAAFKRRSKWR